MIFVQLCSQVVLFFSSIILLSKDFIHPCAAYQEKGHRIHKGKSIYLYLPQLITLHAATFSAVDITMKESG